MDMASGMYGCSHGVGTRGILAGLLCRLRQVHIKGEG